MLRTVVGLFILVASLGSGVATASAAPDLSLATTPNGDFVVGQSTAFILTVTNVGPDATTDPTTVIDVLPSGMTFDAVLAEDWTCTGGTTVKCTTEDSVDTGESLPVVVVYAVPGGAAVPSAVNRALVSNAEDPVTANNSSDYTTTVAYATDMSISLGHVGGALRSGANETINIRVHNEGYYRIDGTTTVSSAVPGGLQVVSVSGGTTWNCTAAQTFSCTTASDGGSTGNYTNIRLVVKATDAGYPSAPVTGTVATAGDQNPANDASTDTIRVLAAHDAALDLVPPPVLRVGAVGLLTLNARNVGTAPLAGATLNIVLPPQLRFVGWATAGWTCTPGPAGTLCTDTRQITGVDALAIRVKPLSPVVGAPVSATVASAGDQNPANNTATGAVAVGPYVPVEHRMTIVSGQRRATTIRVGDRLRVRLAQPRRGARWRVHTQSSALTRPVVTRPSGRIQMRFRAKRAGRATLRFTRRSGGRTRRCSIVVTVVNPGA